MENSNQNKLRDVDIKIYSDFYADPNYALVGYKGKQVEAPGVFFIPYKKPNIFVRLFRKIVERFRHTSEAVPLSTDSNQLPTGVKTREFEVTQAHS